MEVLGCSEKEGAFLGPRDKPNSKDLATQNSSVVYLIMLLFCGANCRLKAVVGSLQSPIQSS